MSKDQTKESITTGEARDQRPPAEAPTSDTEESLLEKSDEADIPSAKKIADIAKKPGGKQEGVQPAETITTQENFLTKPPELLSRYDGNDLKPLPLKAQDISVVVKGHRTRVVFDLVFENPSDRQLAGEFMIPLPDGCSPVYLGMFQGQGLAREKAHAQAVWLNHKEENFETISATDMKLSAKWETQTGIMDWGELRSAKVVNPVKGRQVYENVTRQRIDPALAEWSGASKFTTQIFPIPAKGFKRIVFAYEGPISMKGNAYRHQLPMPSEKANERRLTLHVLKDDITRISLLQNDKKAGDPIAMPYGTKFIFKNHSFSRDNAIIFDAFPEKPQVQVVSTEDEELGGVLGHIRIQPLTQPQKAKSISGKAVFIIDASYSARDKLHNLSGKMLKQLLTQDKTIEEFSVIVFDVTARKITAFLENTPANREKTLKKISKIHLEGATNFQSVLNLVSGDKELSSADTYFLLSDGQITWGEEKTLLLQAKFPKLFRKKWITYRFGDNAVNSSLFDALTSHAGQIVHVNIGDDLKKVAGAHLQTGIPLGKIEFSTEADFLVAGNPQFVYAGQILEMAVKFPAGTNRTKVSLELNGKKKTFPITLNSVQEASSMAGRAWAQLYTNRLLDFHDAAADTLALALSQKFYLTNRAASFIILETDQEYKQHKIEREKYSLAQITKETGQRKKQPGYGIDGAEHISASSLALLSGLRRQQETKIYRTRKPAQMVYDPFSILHRKKDEPIEIYRQAQDLYAKKPGLALRSLSTIVELKPQDDKALRMTGFVLLQWGMYRQASELFARSRTRRPFEPQNFMLEGVALAAQHRVYEAALLYETVLHNTYQRGGEYAKVTTAVLYQDLLRAIRLQVPQSMHSMLDSRIKELKTITDGARVQQQPSGRLILFWNLDNTDVDMHVDEGKFEVSYKNKTSPTGGVLYWDNTAGLGPELYDHPRLSKEGFKVTVNYFGSSAVEGQAPSTTLAISLLYKKDLPELLFYSTTLIDQKSGKISIMPPFRP